jgi:hypothetical protein
MFSIAMTAWAVKFFTNAICFWVNGFTIGRVSTNTPIAEPSRKSGTFAQLAGMSRDLCVFA